MYRFRILYTIATQIYPGSFYPSAQCIGLKHRLIAPPVSQIHPQCPKPSRRQRCSTSRQEALGASGPRARLTLYKHITGCLWLSGMFWAVLGMAQPSHAVHNMFADPSLLLSNRHLLAHSDPPLPPSLKPSIGRGRDVNKQ